MTKLRAFWHLILRVTLCLALLAFAQPAAASGVDPTKISLPKGPASIEGLGRNFVPSLASGTASFGVDIALPPAVGGFGPALALEYDAGGGVSELGLGWRLGGLPSIRRRVDEGLPRFDASDVFELFGIGAPSDLLEVETGVFRQQHETGSFVRVKRSADGQRWEARLKNGFTYRFGGEGNTEEEGGKVVTYLLSQQLDLHGHTVDYTWDTSEGHGLLTRVVWNDFGDAARLAIEIGYEARPDIYERFSSGIAQLLSRRVIKIEVTAGAKLVRRYELGYAGGAHSRLESVKLVGTDGITALPALTFGYTEPQLGSAEIVSMKTPPGRAPAEADVDLADLNGDSLPDLLVGQAGQYRSYLNHDGVTWRAAQSWTAAQSPSVSLSSVGVQLADLDGDGAIDLVAKSGTSSFRYFPGLGETSFSPSVSIQTVPNFTFEDPDVRLADMDCDRRTDVVVTTAAGLAIGYNLNGRDWTVPATVGVIDPSQPLRFSDGRTQLCDVNGDRVQDFCYLRSGSLVYWLGRGRGAFEAARTASGVPSFDESSPWQLHDLNGDGWVDLVHIGVTEVSYALAVAAGGFGSVEAFDGVPENGPSVSVELADMNGSGTTDIVWVDVTASPDGAWRYLELFPDGREGLLKTIDNGLGKRTLIEYEPAALHAARARDAGEPWNSRLNVAMPVVSRTELDVSLGDPVTATEYAYREGTWDPKDRTFAGFAGGTMRDIGDEYTPTLLTENTFDTGLVTRSLRGAILTTELRDESGRVFSTTTNSYLAQLLAGALDGRSVEYAYKSAERVEHVEGTDSSAARTTLTEWIQDEYGNVLEERSWGEVVGDDRLAGEDETITVRTYASHTTDWILGYAASEEVRDGAGARVALVRRYYDGEPFVGLPLGEISRGDLSRQEEWVGPSLDSFELAASTRFDTHGNALEIRDARGGGRDFEWDEVSHTQVTAESVRTGTRSLTQRASYDGGSGTLLGFTDFNGAMTTFGYDALGRVTSVAKPGDSLERPTLRYRYEFGSQLSRVVTEKRVFIGQDETEVTIALHDGAGRKRATLLQDEGSRWALTDVGLLDARGNARRMLRAKYVTTDAIGADELFFDGPGEDAWRDAIGREVRGTTQLGLETRSEYGPLVEKTWDGAQSDTASLYEHTPRLERKDGLGRTITVSWTLKASEIALTYAYDAANRLISRTDPEGNTTRYRRDGRGRAIGVDDPDAGNHVFVFDAANNMVQHQFPDGARSTFVHDLVGRTVEEDWDSDGVADVKRTHDEGGPQFLGLLSEVTDPSGGMSFKYDDRHRPIERTLRIGSSSYTMQSSYDGLDREYLHGYPDGSSVRIHYGKRGLVRRFGDDAVVFDYDADGIELPRVYATGVRETFGYDDDRRLTEHRAEAADGRIIQHMKWVLDGASNVLEQIDLRSGVEPSRSRSSSFGYDNLYRLVRASGPWGETGWDYSPSGNVISRVSTDPLQNVGSMSHGEGAGPHALTGFKKRTFQYDARGRLLDDGERSYSWNTADQLTSVSSKSGAQVENTFDADLRRRTRLERDLEGGSHATHFLDDWSEVHDGKLVRYLVHSGQRIARLSSSNGAQKQATGSGPGLVSAPQDHQGVPSTERVGVPGLPLSGWILPRLDRLLIGLTVLTAMLASFLRLWGGVRRRLVAVVAVAAPLFVLVSCSCSDDPSDGRKPSERGTVRTLTDADELLFADRIESLTETTSGNGRQVGSSSVLPYGMTRYDDVPDETRKHANSPRDQGVGLDHMGARFYSPDLGVWLSVDPVLLSEPESFIGTHPSHSAYSYANSNPVVNVDANGGWAVVLMAVVVVGVLITTQYANAPTITNPQTYSKSDAELALDMAHNVAMLAGAAAAPRAVGCIVKTAVSGGVPTAVSTALKVAGGVAAAETAVAVADKADPSGSARKVVEIAAMTVVGQTKCFAAGTPVAMCDGDLKPIEEIEPGELVVARDPETEDTDCREVLRTSERSGAELIELRLTAPGEEPETIRVTAGHPFWVETRGWVLAGDLQAGDEVTSESGAPLRFNSALSLGSPGVVHNLLVDQFHTYFVGDVGAWVHNNSHPKKPSPATPNAAGRSGPKIAPRATTTVGGTVDDILAGSVRTNPGRLRAGRAANPNPTIVRPRGRVRAQFSRRRLESRGS